MFIDIVFPKNNEEALINRAKELGITDLCFAYPYDKNFKQHVSALPKVKDMTAYSAGILRSSIAMQGNVKIQGVRPSIFITRSSKYNREVLDRASVHLIYDYEVHPGPDSISQRRSNFNHVLARVAEKNGVVIGINFNSLLKASGEIRNKYMGRIKQNLMLAKKYKCEYTIFSGATKPSQMRGAMDILSLLESMAGYNFNRTNIQNTLKRTISDD